VKSDKNCEIFFIYRQRDINIIYGYYEIRILNIKKMRLVKILPVLFI